MTTMLTASSGYAFISHSQASYPSEQPSIDNMQLARRKRRRTSPRELSVLEQEFSKCQKPSKDQRIIIARSVNMSEKAVQIWFQNRRQAFRKQSLRQPVHSTVSTTTGEHATLAMRSSTVADSDPNKKFRLSMSNDGKASVITSIKTPKKAQRTKSLPLSPVKANKLNQHVKKKSPSKQQQHRQKLVDSDRVSPSSPTAKEKECITNLLSLRQGGWLE